MILFLSGNGVFATKSFAKESFLLEYRGLMQDAKTGEKALGSHKNRHSYVYFFKFKQKEWR